MNIYDKKTLNCEECGRCIGEIEFDSRVKFSNCGKCLDSNQLKGEIKNQNPMELLAFRI